MIKNYKNYSIIILAIFTLFSCSTPPVIEVEETNQEESTNNWAERTLNGLTLREKISQMLIYSMNLDFRNSDNKQWQEIINLVETDGIGGIHIWRGNAGLSVTMLNELQRKSKVPILVDMDIERGLQQRFPEGTQIPPLMAIAATGNPQNAFEAGKIVGQEGRALGIHWNFAPVIDVNNNPDNPIINTRALSDDPKMVADFAVQYIKGLHSNGMLATAKHFPGHGDTKTDSHKSLATIPSDSTRLWSIELAPYQKVISEGVDAVMISHLIAPDYQPNSYTPATLSKFWIQDILRERLGFRGAVVTDAMDMGGVANGFSDDFALISAINAGCDIIIQKHNYKNAIDVIENAVNGGYIKESRIDESAKQMLWLKQKAGLDITREVNFKNIQSIVGSKSSHDQAKNIAQQSITIVKNQGNLIPLKLNSTEHLTIIDMYGSKYNHTRSDASIAIMKNYNNNSYFAIDENDNQSYMKSTIDEISNNSTIIINVFAKPSAWKGSVSLTTTQAQFIKVLLKRTKNIIMFSYGNPYVMRDFKEIPVYVCAWESQLNQQIAGVDALFGKIQVSGILPINIPNIAERGYGVNTSQAPLTTKDSTRSKSNYLKRTMPYEVNANISDIREILNKAVQDSAFPGGVLLAAKDGKIFIHEAFGYHTYSKNKPVGQGNIFDIASLTKVISTTSAIMRLYDAGMINLDSLVSKYLPEFADSTIGNTNNRNSVTIRHLLNHTSGLPPFKQYHKINGNINDRIDAIYRTKLETVPGEKTVYSDVGFMLLGKIVERLLGKPLDEYVMQKIFQPIGMEDTYFNPSKKKSNRILPTEYNKYSGQFVKGYVHDENAHSLGGVLGHAGLFSTASDLAIFSQMMLNGGLYSASRIFNKSTIELFTGISNKSMSSRCLGWDSPSGVSSGGVYLSDSSYGHTGFTGTSLWIDPENDIFVILLTNAVHPSRAWKYPKYFNWRQRIHSEVYESLGFTIINPNLKWRKNWNAE